ncbi:MAG: YchJ family metal-binding protein [Flavobacterium sp.]
MVEFKAFYFGPDNAEQMHHERSSFTKTEGHWYYVDGVFFE